MNPTLNTAPRVAWLTALLGLLPLVAPAQQAPTAPAPEAEEDTIVLSPFVVQTNSEQGYYTPEALGATRTRTALIDLPINLTVFNESFINDIGARDLGDIAQFASGVISAPTPSSDVAGGDTLGLNIRGQSAFVPNRNGVRRLRAVDTATIQRVEVIKGPNSLLYGPAAPGGGINYITKRPVQRKIASTTLQVGSYDFYKASMDVNVPTENKNLAVRFVGAYEDSQSWIDRFHMQQKVLYPSMTWWIRPETTLTVEWEQTVQDRVPGGSLPQHNWIDPDDIARLVGRGWNPRGPHDYMSTEMTAFTVELQHKFNDNFNLRLNWSDASWEDFSKNSAPGAGLSSAFTTQATSTGTQPSAGGSAAPGSPLTLAGRPHSYGDRGSWDKYRQAELYNTFEFAGVKVQNLFGYQLGQEKYAVVVATAGSVADTTLWNINDPSTWILSERFAPDYPLNYHTDTGSYARNTLNSGYFINQLSMFNDKLHTLVGARLDKIRGDNNPSPTVHNTVPWNPNGGNAEPPRKPVQTYTYPEWPSKLSPQAGILYKPVDGLSFFANYSRSIVNLYTSVARRPDGTQFNPVPGTGEGVDFGVKSDMFKGRVSGVLSFYRVEEQDIVRNLAQITVPGVNDGIPFVPAEQSGINRSEGVEVDITVRPPIKGLQVGGSYSYNYAYVLSDTSQFVYLNGGAANGTKVETRTNHQMAFTTRHRFTGYLRQDFGSFGPFTNTYFTANGTVMGDRPHTESWYKKVTSVNDPGVMTEPYKLDGFAVFGFGVGGEFKVRDMKINMSLIVRNAFDRDYLENRNYWAAPREFMFTTGVSF